VAAGGPLLDEIVPDGARQMLAAALQAGSPPTSRPRPGSLDEHGHRLVVRATGTRPGSDHRAAGVVTGAGAPRERQGSVPASRSLSGTVLMASCR